MRLSPSKLSTFLSCPQRYEYKYMLEMEEESGQAAINGTFVHAVLELLHGLPAEQRTLTRALGFAIRIHGPWELEPDQAKCMDLIWNLFDLEDPTTVKVLRTEMDITVPYGDHELRGIIDRVDMEDDGYVIVDYKTGKSPRDEDLDEKALGIKFYAQLGALAFGSPPVRVKLLYLGTPQAVTFDVTSGMLAGITSKIDAGIESIERGIFKPKPSLICRWCSFADICPAKVDSSAESE